MKYYVVTILTRNIIDFDWFRNSWKICACTAIYIYFFLSMTDLIYTQISSAFRLDICIPYLTYIYLVSNFWLIILFFDGPYCVLYYWTICNHLIFIFITFQISILLFFTRMFRMRSIWFRLFLILVCIVHTSSTSGNFKRQYRSW